MVQRLFDLPSHAQIGALSPESTDLPLRFCTELELARIALELGAGACGGRLSSEESGIAEQARRIAAPSPDVVEQARSRMLDGEDPLGAALCLIRPISKRRGAGTFFTPKSLVNPMVDWALRNDPARFVDPGCGSGRFAAAAVRRQPDVHVLAVDTDPVATLLTRAALVVAGGRHVSVLNADYTQVDVPHVTGTTAFVGNPPYVRHHELSAAAKSWASAAGLSLGHRASRLAGLHAHFFLATALLARDGDVGCFVTSAEWLDVNYGSVVRALLLGKLGGQALHVLDPRAVPFEDAMTTAVVTCFSVGATPPSISLRMVESSRFLGDLNGGAAVPRPALAMARRWTPLLRDQSDDPTAVSTVPLGDVARVHRGVVTGANDFFVLSRDRAALLGIQEWCRPAITSAREILQCRGVIRDGPNRKLLLDLPRALDRQAHPRLDAYLRMGEESSRGEAPLCARYIPSHRSPWWCVGPTPSPPVVSTYMARQAPLFALNPDGLALLNIGHGIYPNYRSTDDELVLLVSALNGAREQFRGAGRTYHGGLEKFEPGEMEALPVPIAGHGAR